MKIEGIDGAPFADKGRDGTVTPTLQMGYGRVGVYMAFIRYKEGLIIEGGERIAIDLTSQHDPQPMSGPQPTTDENRFTGPFDHVVRLLFKDTEALRTFGNDLVKMAGQAEDVEPKWRPVLITEQEKSA